VTHKKKNLKLLGS